MRMARRKREIFCWDRKSQIYTYKIIPQVRAFIICEWLSLKNNVMQNIYLTVTFVREARNAGARGKWLIYSICIESWKTAAISSGNLSRKTLPHNLSGPIKERTEGISLMNIYTPSENARPIQINPSRLTRSAGNRLISWLMWAAAAAGSFNIRANIGPRDATASLAVMRRESCSCTPPTAARDRLADGPDIT